MNSMFKTFAVALVMTGLASQAVAQMRGPGPGGGNRHGPGPQPSPGGGRDERGGHRGDRDREDRERRDREERERQDRDRRDREDRDRRRQEEDRRREEERRHAGPIRPTPGPGPYNPNPYNPNPYNPGSGPVRPGPGRDHVRPGFDPRDRSRVDFGRDRVRQERDLRRLEIDRYNRERSMQRDSWRRQNAINVYRDINAIRNADRWMNRYNNWWYDCPRPVYIGAPVNWYRPMPAPGSWNYYDVDVVSDNLEYLGRDIYNIMAPISYSTANPEYAYRLRDTLARLADAAENFNDTVDRTYDWSDSLYELFYLENTLELTEQTLAGYSQAWRVQSQVQAMRYYVNELLWQYRVNYGY